MKAISMQATTFVLAGALLFSGCSQESADSQTRQAIEAYFQGLDSGDASRIPLAAEVYFQGPMVPDGIRGEPDERAFLQEVAIGLQLMSAERIFVDGGHSCAPFVFTIKEGPTISGVDCFRVVDGLIVETQPFFDPRPMLPE